MEDLIDIRNRRERCNVIKWYNVNYQPVPLVDKQQEEVVEEDLSTEEAREGKALEILARISQAKEDKLLAAIEDGKRE